MDDRQKIHRMCHDTYATMSVSLKQNTKPTNQTVSIGTKTYITIITV